MRHLTIFLVISFLSIVQYINGQTHTNEFCNEWIDYNKTYYKAKVYEDGMYRLDANVLQQAGVNISSIPTNGIMIYHQGEQVPFHVQTNNGSLVYIQFYGERNRGDFDVNMYNEATDHFNREYSLINDTSAYYITWSSTPSTHQFETVSANLSNLPAKENYCWTTAKTVYDATWNKGYLWNISTEYLSKSIFEKGEGFGSGKSTTINTDVLTNNVYSNGPNATITKRAFASQFSTHIAELSLNNQLKDTFYFSGALVNDFVMQVPSANLSNNNTIQLKGTNGSFDTYFASHVSIRYPHNYDFENTYIFPFELEAGPRKYLEITNFNTSNATNGTVFVYDLTNKRRTQCLFGNNTAYLDIDAFSSTSDFIFINESHPDAIRDILQVESVTFTDYSSVLYQNYDYVILTHPSLRTSSSGSDPIGDYLVYRSSPTGGGYNVVVIEIDELYDQFAYGIKNHPLAVRYFANYIHTHWTNPEYFFIIGKGRSYNEVRLNVPTNLLIPTFGYPPSDNVLMGTLDHDYPTIPVGRLAATSGDQVALYLNKIKEVEYHRNSEQSLDSLGWTKNILHLGGGKTSSEQNIIRNNLQTMENFISGPSYGGKVESFFKTSSSPIQSAQSSYLDSLINSGVSLITFFGHSSANSFDFNLDHPQNYSNAEKYPLVLALGCYGGSMFGASPYISEDFIFEPQAGASVFLASVGAAALSSLNLFAFRFYDAFGQIQYGEGAAKSVQYATQNLETTNNGNLYTTTTQMVCNYMAYHGDPASRLSTNEYPDYYIDKSLVSHTPSLVTAQMNSFNLDLDIYNLGKVVSDSFNIRVERIYPNGIIDPIAASFTYQASAYQNTVSIPIPVGTSNNIGINFFNVYVDADYEVDERPTPYAEDNNTVIEYEVLIISDDVTPVYPYEFAIVPQDSIVLKASTGNAFANTTQYVIQIDTTEYFNSPIKQEYTSTQSGGLVEWSPSIVFEDSTVYYWRVSQDSLSPSSSYNWNTSSFIHMDSTYPGWNQSHFFQFLKDERTSIKLEEPDREFKYIQSLQEVSSVTGKTPDVIYHENVAIYLNGSRLEQTRCPQLDGIYVAVIEPSTLDFWQVTGPINNELHGGINCDGAGRTAPNLLYQTQVSARQDSLENLIRNVVPDGHYVLMYTLNNAFAHTWSNGLIDAIKAEGIWYVDELVNGSDNTEGLPWGCFFKKGDTSYTYKNSIISLDPNGVIQVSGVMSEVWIQGNQTSTIIGPANEWNLFSWDGFSTDGMDMNDKFRVDLYGVDSNINYRTLLIHNFLPGDTSLTHIDPTQFPYLELKWHTLDSVNKTSSQLKYWRVLADLVPDAALRPEIMYSLDSSSVMQGQVIKFETVMENISDTDMDSMLVKYEVLGSGVQLTKYERLAPLPSGDTLHLRTSFPTIDLTGTNYQLLVEINPDNDQREKHRFNNVGLLNFQVRRDVTNPLMDVTFDGVHIMNRDIVSGKPEIVVTLLDENQYLGLDDLEDFRVIIRHSSFPNGELLLDPSNTDMEFVPADNTRLDVENKARLILRPILAADGMYTLFVSANDKSGNNSGDINYSVDFEVVNESSISYLMNYPNPFTTSTHFVFTLTGNELPDYMKIQIFTVSGKIVREIDMEELGTLRIGQNKTEYAWNGTDEFGDPLANGVYLYRVITRKDGDNVKHLSNRNDFMFRQGFGKMYLMR